MESYHLGRETFIFKLQNAERWISSDVLCSAAFLCTQWESWWESNDSNGHPDKVFRYQKHYTDRIGLSRQRAILKLTYLTATCNLHAESTSNSQLAANLKKISFSTPALSTNILPSSCYWLSGTQPACSCSRRIWTAGVSDNDILSKKKILYRVICNTLYLTLYYRKHNMAKGNAQLWQSENKQN